MAIRILVVTDQTRLYDTYVRCFRDVMPETALSLATDAQQALDKIQEEHPDALLISDILSRRRRSADISLRNVEWRMASLELVRDLRERERALGQTRAKVVLTTTDMEGLKSTLMADDMHGECDGMIPIPCKTFFVNLRELLGLPERYSQRPPS